MRRIAIINQKGGVGKTTTTANLGAALAIQGRRVVVIDMDAQANLSLALGVEARSGTPTAYSVLTGDETIGACLRNTKVPGLRLLPSNIDLSGAELELASAMGREYLLRDALKEWDDAHRKQHGRAAADYVLFDCPPSLGLLSINALAAAGEVLITLQTEFLALQGMSKLVEIVALLKKRLNPDLVVAGIVPTLYDIRLKLAREVLGEIRRYFKDQVVPHPIRANVKLAEAPSFAQTIFEYAPDSHGALDYVHLAHELVLRESRDADLVGLAAFDPSARLPIDAPPAAPRRMPPPRKPAAGTIVPTPSKKPETTPARDGSVSAPSRIEIVASPSTNAPARVAAITLVKTSVPEPPAKVAPVAANVSSIAKNTASTNGSKAVTAPKSEKAPAKPPVPASVKVTAAAVAPKPNAKSKEIENAATKAIPAPKPTASKPTLSKSTSHEPKPTTTPAAPAAQEPASRKAAPARPTSSETKPSNGAHAKPARETPAIAPRTQAKTLKAVPRTARVDDIPPLPPDAFEILSTPIDP
jgi:chromosome partitioning protein